MKANKNFENQYEAVIQPKDREKALSIFKKMSESKPGLFQEAKVSIKDQLNGGLYILIDNTSAFDESTINVIRKFLNQLQYKRDINDEENC